MIFVIISSYEIIGGVSLRKFKRCFKAECCKARIVSFPLNLKIELVTLKYTPIRVIEVYGQVLVRLLALRIRIPKIEIPPILGGNWSTV